MVKMTIGAATDFNTNSGRGAAVASAPVAVRPPDLSGTGLIGSSLRVDPGAWRGQPAPELTFQWQRNGIDIPEAVEAVYTPGPADDEADLRCVVTARNGSGRITAATEAIRVTYAPPRLLGELPDVTYDLMADGSRMVLAGQNFSGENLSFSVTGADAVIYPRSGGLSIPTSAPRVAEPVTIVASNSGGQAQVTFNVTISSVSNIPATTPPFVISAPALSGAGLIGTPVQADPGVWGGVPAPALALQWQRDGVDIPAATGTLYIPAAEDDGTDLRCVVTAANGASPVKVVTETIRIRYEPPSALGGLFDEVFDQYSGIELISTAQDFIGENLTFSVSGAGAKIDSRTGMLELNTDTPFDGALVTVTASNSGGSADSSFMVTIEADAQTAEALPPILTAGSLRASRLAVSVPLSTEPDVLGYDLRHRGSEPSKAPGEYVLMEDVAATVNISDLTPGGVVEIEARCRTVAGFGAWSKPLSVTLPAEEGPTFTDTFLGTAGANVNARLPEIGGAWENVGSSNLRVRGDGTATHVGTNFPIATTQGRLSLFDGGYWAKETGALKAEVRHNASGNRVHLVACWEDAGNYIVATVLSGASGGNITIRKAVAGVETVLANTTTAGVVFNTDLPKDYTATLVRAGNALSLLVNGSEVLKASDTVLPSGTKWGLGGGAPDTNQYFSTVTFKDTAALGGTEGGLPVPVGALEMTWTMPGSAVTPPDSGSQTITWTSGFTGHMSAAAAATTELGKTYRATCTVDTSGVPLGTPIQLKAMRTSDMMDDSSETFATKWLLGQDVVYSNGGTQALDLRWTDWTGDGVCYVGVLAQRQYDRRGRNDNTGVVPLIVPGIESGDELVVSDLEFSEFLDTGHGEDADWTDSVTVIRRHGVEMTLNQAATVKRYANGDIAIERNAGLEVVSITPSGAPQYWNVDGSNFITPSATPTSVVQKINGTEKNIWAAGWEEAANKGVPNQQAIELRPEGSFPDPFYIQVAYDNAYNVDPGNTGSNIVVDEDMTLTKALCLSEPIGVQPGGSNQGRARTLSFTHFTFVSTLPADGSFRPFPGAASKAPTHNLSEVDFDLLPSLSIPGTVPEIDTFTYANALQIARVQPSPQVRTNPTNAWGVAALATGVYGRETTEELAERFYAACITDKLSAGEKETIATGLVQFGLDVHYCNLLRNEAWSHGGATPPTKEAAVLASVILGDATMQGLITAGALQFDVRDNPSLAEAARRYPHVWDNLTGPVVQANIDVERSIFIETAATNYQMRAAMMYFPENLGMPSYQDSGKPLTPWVTDGNPAGQNTWNAAYRLISKTSSLIPILAMYHTPGAREVYANETTLKWFDMMFRYVLVNEGSITSTERLRTFQREMWKAHRSDGTPVAVGRFGLNDETVVSAAEIVTLFSDTYDAAFAAKFPTITGVSLTEARVKGGAVEGVPRLRVFGRGVPMVFPLASEWFVDPEIGSSLLNDATIPTLYTLVSGELPAGVTLDTATGVLSGTPVAATIGDFEEIAVRASNAFGDSSQIIRFSIRG